MRDNVPIVDYLVLDDDPHLIANECVTCGARYFGRRNGCAACPSVTFETVRIATTGTVRAFTIVWFAAPGIPVPFVPAIVDCAGTNVRGNVVGIDADQVRLGMDVNLTTYEMGTDTEGTRAMSYGFRPST